MISAKDFGAQVFQCIRSGIPELHISVPVYNRTLDITDPTMLAQHRQDRKRALAQHNRGRPIFNYYAKRSAR